MCKILFEKLLSFGEIVGKRILDIGCGTGWFPKRASQLGSDVFSVDIGISLLKKVSMRMLFITHFPYKVILLSLISWIRTSIMRILHPRRIEDYCRWEILINVSQDS